MPKRLVKITAMQLFCLQLRVGGSRRRSCTRPAPGGGDEQHHTGAGGDRLSGGPPARRKGDFYDYHVIRHMADIEAIHTFEGTATIQALIVGRDITCVSASNWHDRHPGPR